MRVLNVKKTGLGTPAIAAGVGALQCTVTDNGVGDYTINFNNPFAAANTLTVQVTPTTADRQCYIGTVAAGSVQILCRSIAGTPAAAESDFHLTVFGLDTTDLY